MLKLSEHAIGMLASKYRAVLKSMLIRNTAAFAACCVILGAPAAGGAASITYTGDGADLQTAPIGGASSPSLIPSGVSGNTVTVDYTTGTDPWRVFGGLSDSATVTGNSVYFKNGAVSNNFYGGYDAAGTGGFGAGNNTVTISGGTIQGFVIAGISLNGNATNNKITMSGGSVLTQLRGGSANAAGDAVGNSVVITGGTVGDGLGSLANGWVLGGYSKDGTSSGNTVTISGSAVVNCVDAGESTNGPVTGNKLFITGGDILGGPARAGWSDTGLVSGNEAYMSGGVIHDNAVDHSVGHLDGGLSISGNSENNVVTVSGGSVTNVYGGSSVSADATGNRAVISGDAQVQWVIGGRAGGTAGSNNVLVAGAAQVAGNVYGGHSDSGGDAIVNRVVIAGGTVGGEVYGGSSSNGSATGNSVLLTGGMVNGRIYGGFSDTGSANDNTVTIDRYAQLATTSSIYGGWTNPSFSGTSAGNTLNVNGFRGTLYDVNKFQNYNFFLPASLRNGGTVLTVTSQTNLSGTHVVITGMESGTLLAPGNTVTLISSTQNAPDSYSATNVRSGISLIYDFSIEAAGTALTATVKSAGVNPQTKALVEGYAANMAFVNQGADLAGGTGMADAMAKAKAANGNIASFGAVSGGSSRYKTGSHADVDGTSLMTGFVTKRDIENGSLVRGLFLEAGWGNYDTYNSFANMPSVRGDGDTSYYGLGALLRHDAPDGRYLEGSVRGGKSRTTFGSGDLNNASYTTNSGYYGAHIGIGKLKTEGNKTLDYYAKYFWTHQNGSDVRVAGEPFSFAGVDSSRLRGGVRLSQEKPDGKSTSYVGLAYEYEFDGKAKGSVYGLDLEAPSLKGGTGIVELGMSFKSRPASSNTLELGLQGYAGKREGVTGTVQFKRVF
ncbi:autotransporter outer membrane beta-barrel domain-containing protein [Sporomusa sphaeroides DSM 2875]|uniref:autotransporter outer membrane beta-barrel domain-containing protein n=1 Tax=Sporomusa sphaeroides TaxID=47679 RepID=UPI00202E30C8|nr:autotransporter outer membrane beta-barrel domain-containing protein [Sporomusa sphaeroides]MCM0758844.1 autotransporter outer membrane beta-barrel domain-containing protein [Sporomusa sphaeroides DSM 2875]